MSHAAKLMRIANEVDRLERLAAEPDLSIKVFLKEQGDYPVTNPDTGRRVKIKSLRGPKGKKLLQKEYEDWKEHRKKKEESLKGKTRQDLKEWQNDSKGGGHGPEGKWNDQELKEANEAAQDKKTGFAYNATFGEFRQENLSNKLDEYDKKVKPLLETTHEHADVNFHNILEALDRGEVKVKKPEDIKRALTDLLGSLENYKDFKWYPSLSKWTKAVGKAVEKAAKP